MQILNSKCYKTDARTKKIQDITYPIIQGVSGGIVNNLGGCIIDYSE
jgi:hypothetical protein